MWRLLRSLFLHRSTAPSGGEAGEDAAAAFLRSHGFSLLARNWRNPQDEREEIDLVALDGEILVFVEVKARAANALAPGYFAVNADKKKVLRRAALAYLRGMRVRPATFRLDIVEVAQSPRSAPQVLHFENVPLFGKHDRL